MKLRITLAVILFALTVGAGMSQAHPTEITGNWRVEVTFKSGESRSLRFEALSSGKGSFLAIAPRPNQINPTEPAAAHWTRTGDDSVTFSGPVLFPLGNVGIERGTLVLKGKMQADGSIAGDADFFAGNGNPKEAGTAPSKSGSFKATRING